MKILITGAAGFVGSNVLNRLSKSHNVIGCDNMSFGSKENIKPNSQMVYDSFATLDNDFLDGFDLLIHCATANIIFSQSYPIETFKTNALETIELFERFKDHIIYTSTASVYGNAHKIPTTESAQKLTYNAYDQSKLIAEKYLESRGNYTILRLSNVYGPNQRPDNPYCGVIGKFIESARKGELLNIYGDGIDTRDFTYVGDVVDAVELCINEPFNDTFNIASGKERSILALAALISYQFDRPTNFNFITPRKIDGIHRRCLDISKAEKILGWKPKTEISNGIKNTIEWMKKEDFKKITT